MDDDELRQRLRVIIDAEESESPDWSTVEHLSAALAEEISGVGAYEPPHLVWHYLDDVDIRIRDIRYAEDQRKDIRRFVDTGDRSRLESRPIPAWSCLLICALLVGLAVWLLTL